MKQALAEWDVDESVPTVKILQNRNQIVNSFDVNFWYFCFVHLFCRGDCAERDSRRANDDGYNDLQGKVWAKTLLDRVDFAGWRLSKDFIACLYNIFFRREQFKALKVVIKHHALYATRIPALARLTQKDLLQTALQHGDAKDIRKLLQESDLEETVRSALITLQLTQKLVKNSDAERQARYCEVVSIK